MTALAAVHGLLGTLGYARTRRLLERLTPLRSARIATPDEIADAERLATLAAAAGHHGVVSATCLRQALVVHGLLRKRGLDPVLQFGVDRQAGVTDMHAWVELEGVPLAQPTVRHRAFSAQGSPRKTS